MMMNLKQWLLEIKGIVVGSMTKMKDNDIPWEKCTNCRGYYQNYTIPIYQFSCRTHTGQQSIDFR
jgi:muramoyltetrapeptide carboxypeptidase